MIIKDTYIRSWNSWKSSKVQCVSESFIARKHMGTAHALYCLYPINQQTIDLVNTIAQKLMLSKRSQFYKIKS